jgi:hypothetical protein
MLAGAGLPQPMGHYSSLFGGAGWCGWGTGNTWLHGHLPFCMQDLLHLLFTLPRVLYLSSHAQQQARGVCTCGN